MQTQKAGMLTSEDIQHRPGVSLTMPEIVIRFDERETMPDRIERRARELGLTAEELCRRYINEGMRDFERDESPSVPGQSFDDMLVKNGVYKPPK